MKDHKRAAAVNEVTAIAQQYAGTGQLREHLSRAMNRYFDEQAEDFDTAVAALQHITDNYGGVCGNFELCQHQACLDSSGAYLTALDAQHQINRLKPEQED